MRHYVPQDTLISIYFSLFNSHISYCPQIWAQSQNLHTNRVYVLQKRALRIITFSDFNASSSPLFLRLGILNFFDFIKYLNIVFVYNVINCNCPISILDAFNFTFNIRDRETARLKKGILRLPKCSTISFGNRSIHYQSVLAWNNLQQYLSVVDLSLLPFHRLKYLTKFYFLSSYSSLNS